MKEEIKKTREQIRLEKQAEKLRENLKKRKVWQDMHNKEKQKDEREDKG